MLFLLVFDIIPAMRQEQERSGLEHEQRNISPFRKLGSGEFIGVPPFSLPKDSGKEEGIRKTRFALRQEDRRDNGENSLIEKKMVINPLSEILNHFSIRKFRKNTCL